MAIFKVKRIVDAFVIYEADVDADSPEQASSKAQADEDAYEWGTGDSVEYDARRFVTLDAGGIEIESTERGDL
jgi:hypothetical protein